MGTNSSSNSPQQQTRLGHAAQSVQQVNDEAAPAKWFDVSIEGNPALGPAEAPVTMAAHCAGEQDAYFPFRDALFSSTPTFFINGIAVVGAQPYEVFQQVIVQELAAGEQAAREAIPL